MTQYNDDFVIWSLHIFSLFLVLLSCFIRCFGSVEHFRSYIRRSDYCRRRKEDVSKLYYFILSTRLFHIFPNNSLPQLYASVMLLHNFMVTNKDKFLKNRFYRYIGIEKNRKRSRFILPTSTFSADLYSRLTVERNRFTICLYSILHRLNRRIEMTNYRNTPLNYVQRFHNPVSLVVDFSYLLRLRKPSKPLFALIKLPAVAFRHMLAYLSDSDKIALLLSTPEMFIYRSTLFDINFKRMEDFVSLYRGICPMRSDNAMVESQECFCRLCNIKCPCQSIFTDSILSAARFMFENFRFKKVDINSERTFNFVFRNSVTFSCQSLVIGLTINFTDFMKLGKCIDLHEMSLSLLLDESIRIVQQINIPTVRRLSLRLVSRNHSDNVSTKKWLLREICCQNTSLRFLQITGLPSYFTTFWSSQLSTLVLIDAHDIYCTQFTALFNICTTLSDFTLTTATIATSCNPKHFAAAFRSDRYNFQFSDTRLQQVSRLRFLTIQANDLKCSNCQDVVSESYVMFNVYRLKYCIHCRTPETCSVSRWYFLPLKVNYFTSLFVNKLLFFCT